MIVMISAWCRNRSRMAVAAGTSPKSLPQSSNDRFEVIIVDLVSYRRRMISKRYSADRLGNCLMLQSVVLATSMPMLAGTGGNAGSQSATLVIRALALGEVTPKDVFRILVKELWVSIPLALVPVLVGVVRVLFHTGRATTDYSVWMIGLAVSAALAAQVFTSTLIGALLPSLRHDCGTTRRS